MIFIGETLFNIQLIQLIVLSILLLFSSVTDLKFQKIPNYLTFPGMIIALLLHTWGSGIGGFFFSLKGIAAGIGVLLIPYVLGGMGAGDAKLMGAVGGFLGAKGVLGAFIFTAIIGGVYALLIIFIFRLTFENYFKSFYQRILTFAGTHVYIPEPEESRTKRPKLCYGLAIALGTGLYLLLKYMGYHFFT